jgi:hypothetical protein
MKQSLSRSLHRQRRKWAPAWSPRPEAHLSPNSVPQETSAFIFVNHPSIGVATNLTSNEAHLVVPMNEICLIASFL